MTNLTCSDCGVVVISKHGIFWAVGKRWLQQEGINRGCRSCCSFREKGGPEETRVRDDEKPLTEDCKPPCIPCYSSPFAASAQSIKDKVKKKKVII